MSEIEKITYDEHGAPIIHESKSEHLDSVVSGKVQIKKKTKFGRYLAGLTPVVIGLATTAGKKLLWDTFKTMLKVDEPSGGYYDRRSDVLARPSYRNYYEDQYPAYQRPEHYDYNDLTFETRGDAERVLEQMRGILARQKVVRVLQLYDLCRLPGTYPDNYYGWASLYGVHVVATRDGRYKLTLPPPMSIN